MRYPCPCGYYGDLVKSCTCSSSTVTKYQKRISGPLLDRIDIHVEVPRVECDKLLNFTQSGDNRLGEALHYPDMCGGGARDKAYSVCPRYDAL